MQTSWYRWIFVACITLFGLILIGCGDDDGSSAVDGGMDSTIQDAKADAADAELPKLALGTACPSGTCADGLTCMNRTVNVEMPEAGYCSKFCTSDAECGADAFCTPPVKFYDPEVVATERRICVPRCGPGETCEGERRMCRQHWRFVEYALPEKACLPGNADAVTGDACWSWVDCADNTICWGFLGVNPYDSPGGVCGLAGCTVGDDSTCDGDSVCRDLGSFGRITCIDTCEVDEDCRMAEGYRCIAGIFDPDPEEPTGLKYCNPPDVMGMACETKANCGPEVLPWECLTGDKFPGGSCSKADCNPVEDDCPVGAWCHDPTPDTAGDEYCTRICAVDEDCRMGEGYRCLPQLVADPENGNLGCRLPLPSELP